MQYGATPAAPPAAYPTSQHSQPPATPLQTQTTARTGYTGNVMMPGMSRTGSCGESGLGGMGTMGGGAGESMMSGSMTSGPMTSGPMTSGPMTSGPLTAGPMNVGGGGACGFHDRGVGAPGATGPATGNGAGGEAWASGVQSFVSSGAASALGMDGASAKVMGAMASEAAKTAAANYFGGANISEIQKTFTGSRLNVLRYYFEVNNAYVMEKLKILLLPYRHGDWERRTVTAAGGTYAPMPPSEDVNAPDLYLPLMGYVTYILVAGFYSGADGRFTPEVLGMTASSGMAIVCLEVTAIKLALYLLQSESSAAVPTLDLLAVSGYKFLGLVLVVLAKAFLGVLAGYVMIACAGANVGTFLYKTLGVCLAESNASGFGNAPGFYAGAHGGLGSPGKSERKRKQTYSLLGVGLLQPIFFWYLARV